MTRLTLKEDWPEVKGPVVMYIQATIAGGYPHRVTIEDDNGRTLVDKCESPGVSSEDFGKQFLNYKHKVDSRDEHIFNVTIEHNPDNKGWCESSYKVSDSLNIADSAIFGIVLSNDGGGDLDYNDCVVIISLYQQSFD
ncbi:MAG: hypothetical protein GTO45_13440 [Candidatus Aminicenantes bacterium]|nr:hypothetical protein [Candidatus Aminicenantes bacterium]NIM79782.1 hypothetical protein [Candidatus Aminicenantes bacterium]NIN19110.1 hypothetical protein [Candidatus Aminicenantes bacterium]NIN43012.1 hypothetical protein [Candidatus Aminicenantes bacterium]NIN85755.1 hypothetical protein [Candidatus Aminicenantes bacterium]